MDSYEDWENKTADGEIPVSCCGDIAGTIGTFTCNNSTETLYRQGCAYSFGHYIRSHAVSLGAAGVAICIIQFIGIFFAVYLARQIKKRQGGSGF